MTNEDITKELTQMRKNFDSNSVYGSYCIDCLDMAIEALKEQPERSQNTSSKQPALETFGAKTGETCEDVISRQAAIDNLKRHLNETDVPDSYPGIFNAIEEWLSDWEVPPAQPEIIRCKDCRFWQNQEEGVVEVPICARPENRHEKHPFRFIVGADGYCSFAERITDE